MAGVKNGTWTAWSDTGEMIRVDELIADSVEEPEAFISLEGNRE